MGFFYLNPPAIQGKPFARGSALNIGLGDSGGPLQNVIGTYGIFAMPYGVAGVFSSSNLQQETEGGTISQAGAGPVVAVLADGALASPGSGNDAVKAPAGAYTISQFIVNSPFSFVPPSGTYRVAMRVRTGTNGAGANNEIQFDSGGTSALGPTTLKPNQASTTYTWFVSGTFTLDGIKTVQPRWYDVSSATTTTVDWIVDQFILIPMGLGGSEGPSDLFAQWLFDRETNMVRG